jgi:hypothetical protein
MRRHILTLAVGLLAGATLAGGAAIAVTSNAFTYSSLKTGYLALSPMGFAPDSVGSLSPNDYENIWGAAGLTSADGSRCFNTGVTLPNNARIKSIRFFYTSDASSDFSGSFIRVNAATGTSTSLAQVNPANDSNTRTAVTAAVPSTKQVVKNGTFQYGVGTCPVDGTRFHGARITYTYRTAGD